MLVPQLRTDGEEAEVDKDAMIQFTHKLVFNHDIVIVKFPDD